MGRELRAETALAVEAVRGAIELIRSLGRRPDVGLKAGRDVVTPTDVAVEELVRDVLGSAGVPVVGEELGGTAPADADRWWLVDPLCGTRNYASDIPLCSTNVALVERGEVVAAVVGDPWRGDVLVAERGRGAWVAGGGERVVASATSRVVVVEEGGSSGDRRRQVAALAADVIAADEWDFRAFATTQTLQFLARGQVAAYVTLSTEPLHGAAGVLLASEAGAVVTDAAGAPWTVASTTIVGAADADLHDRLQRLVVRHEVADRGSGA
jgi:myo-inositol-1(or 4)-monophosphatase